MKTVHLNGYIQVEKYPFIENSESHCNEGFVLFNELGERFAFCWDNEQQCYENFLVDKSGYDHVLSFSSDCGCEIRIMETQEYFKAMLDILIYVNKEEKVRFHLSNEQGKGAYYSHLIMFKINNEWIYEEL